MTPENIQFLNEQRHHHDTLIKALYLRSLSAEVRTRMQQIIGEEFQPGYSTDLWCPPCVSDMVLKLYRHYDEWLAQQPKEPDRADEIMGQLDKEFDELLDQWPATKEDESKV